MYGMLSSSQKWNGREGLRLVNKNRLAGKITENGFTQRSLARHVGMSKNSMCNKINGKTSFNTVEVENICNVLGITSSTEKADIFFAGPS
jgi:transcriptional regulator with XRE-family HTH domain